jgi:hypothetical protein
MFALGYLALIVSRMFVGLFKRGHARLGTQSFSVTWYMVLVEGRCEKRRKSIRLRWTAEEPQAAQLKGKQLK